MIRPHYCPLTLTPQFQLPFILHLHTPLALQAICGKAADLKANLVVIASHGAGVLADFGSVARWCSENSSVPVVLVPPHVLGMRAGAGLPPANTVLVSATDSLTGVVAGWRVARGEAGRRARLLFVRQNGSLALLPGWLAFIFPFLYTTLHALTPHPPHPTPHATHTNPCRPARCI
jgi:hypothetical protein